MGGISTHVLDTGRGQPISGMEVVFEARAADGGWSPIGAAATGADGRVDDLACGMCVAAGVYRLRFDTGKYFRASGIEGFFPEVQLIIQIREPERHHHVPLLLSPYGFSTYRGS